MASFDEQQVSALYDELRRLAAHALKSERPGHTLQPTALVHEAYLRMRGDSLPAERGHFLATAARVMRHVLVDYARARKAEKRGAGAICVALDDALEVAARQDVDVESLDEALSRLEQDDPTLSRIVELRYFAGLTVIEVGEALGLSRASVEREWVVARAWLRTQV